MGSSRPFLPPNCIRSVINVGGRDSDECRHVAYRFFLNIFIEPCYPTSAGLQVEPNNCFFFVTERADKIIYTESIAIITCIHIKMVFFSRVFVSEESLNG